MSRTWITAAVLAVLVAAACSTEHRQLKKVASEIARTVRVMDGRNRQRFQNDGKALGEWIMQVRCWARREELRMSRRLLHR